MYQILQKDTIIYGGIFWNQLTQKRLSNKKCLEQYGYKVYSQNDEDGMIQEIFRRIGTTNQTFVEFGVQNGLESNCHYLLLRGWNGLWLEGDPQFVKEIRMRFHPVIQTGQLQCGCAFLTRDNINHKIGEHGISGEIDLLSIDVDGNDYYIWEAVHVVNPRVVVIEYNGKIPPDCDWKMAYYENHQWDGSDWHGASLKALELLGRQKGYQLVGTNINGVNAFFVRKDLAAGRFYKPSNAESLFNPLRLNLFHRSGHPARYCLKGQQEGLGLFNYFPDADAIPGIGFHDQEGADGGRYAWMSERNSQILVRNCQNYQTLEIQVFIAKEVLEVDSYWIRFSVESGIWQDFQVNREKLNCQIKLPDKNDCVRKINVSVPFLWRPSEILGTGDQRQLGMAIVFDQIEGI